MNEQEIQEIKDRGNIYKSLIEYEPFKFLQGEVKETIENTRDAIVGSTEKGEDNLYEKGILIGIGMVLDTPIDAVTEMEQLLEKENS